MTKENLNKTEKVQSRVDEWAEFSMSPQTEETLKEHYLNESLRYKICTTYILKVSTLSSKFIEELIALSTFVFNSEEDYTEEHKKIVLELAMMTEEKEGKDIQLQKLLELKHEYPHDTFIQNLILKSVSYDYKGPKLINPIRSQIDWYNVKKFQNLEPWFADKYSEYLKIIVAGAYDEIKSLFGKDK